MYIQGRRIPNNPSAQRHPHDAFQYDLDLFGVEDEPVAHVDTSRFVDRRHGRNIQPGMTDEIGEV